MPLKVTKKHFKHGARTVDMTAEVAAVFAKDDVRSFTPLPRPFIEHLAQFYPLVRNAAEIAELPRILKGDKEIGFCPLFCPKLIDDTCQLGIFPLAIDVHRDVFVYAPKCHTQRAITRLTPKEVILGLNIMDDDEGNFNPAAISVSSSLAKRCVVSVNQVEDCAAIFDLIHQQHGENWLCEKLRACLLHMMLHRADFETKMLFFAVRERETNTLVSCEVGYIVADMYTSATGAYCVNGAGSLQLLLLAGLLKQLGVKIWDLGMFMDYKGASLGCTSIPRKQWLNCVKQRIAVAKAVEESGGAGGAAAALERCSASGPFPAAALLNSKNGENDAKNQVAPAPQPAGPLAPASDVPATTPSKAQLKKAAKAQFLGEKKCKKGEATREMEPRKLSTENLASEGS